MKTLEVDLVFKKKQLLAKQEVTRETLLALVSMSA